MKNVVQVDFKDLLCVKKSRQNKYKYNRINNFYIRFNKKFFFQLKMI